MHKINFRIYYEDTDCGGVVYHSNYLKFTERARTEMLRDVQINQGKLSVDENIFFVVSEIKSKFIKPAKLDDLILIETKILQIKNITINLNQKIYTNGVLIFENEVKIACVEKKDDQFLITKIPDFIKQKLQKYAN